MTRPTSASEAMMVMPQKSVILYWVSPGSRARKSEPFRSLFPSRATLDLPPAGIHLSADV